MASVRDQLQRALGQTYRIDRELGGGGMSRVFLSTDITLDRQVVLKVLPDELAASVSVERFKREISVAARLQHAHIVPLLSAGEVNGLPWFSMPFVEGQSLRVRLARGELPIAEAVRLLRDIASALSYAHGKGVVHRDIKPENILLPEGGAAVTDFGVAKAIVDAGTERGFTLTSVGVALGTPAYMAPEQAAGDPRTDHRADLYAFGVVAYEMLAGRNPFAGRSPQQMLAAHMSEVPAPLEQLRSATPPVLAQLVNRCLAKSAADRPQSAQEIVNALDALATPTGSAPFAAASGVASPMRSRRVRQGLAAAALAVLATGGLLAWRAFSAQRLDPRTVAVLPFDLLTNDTAVVQAARVAADWLSQGIVQTDSANVVASTMVNFAIGDAKPGSADIIDRVARVTHAGTVVTGSAGRFGDSIRIQVSIVDARTKRVIRAIDPVTGPVWDPIVAINALRDRVLGSIVSGDVAKRVAIAGQPPRYTAYKEYMAGMEVFIKNQASSRPYFRRAIALDSTFASPYVSLVFTFTNAGMRDSAATVVVGLETLRERLSPVDRLFLELARAALRNQSEAGLRASQEIAKRTSDPTIYYLVGAQAVRLARPDIAIPALLRSDSASAALGWVPNVFQLAEAYHLAGEHKKELAHLDLGRRRYPNNLNLSSRRVRAYAGLRDSASGRALTDTLLRSMSNPADIVGLNTISGAAWEFDAHGDTATARRLTRLGLDWVMSHIPAQRSVGWERSVGRAFMDLGELDSAQAHLSRAFPDTSFGGIGTAAYLAVIQIRRGDSASARRTADSIGAIVRPWDIGATSFWRATVVAELGDRDQAVQLLQRAQQQGIQKQQWHYTLPLKSLRGYQPFEALIKPQK